MLGGDPRRSGHQGFNRFPTLTGPVPLSVMVTVWFPFNAVQLNSAQLCPVEQKGHWVVTDTALTCS